MALLWPDVNLAFEVASIAQRSSLGKLRARQVGVCGYEEENSSGANIGAYVLQDVLHFCAAPRGLGSATCCGSGR